MLDRQSSRIAIATAADIPQLVEDDRPLLDAIRALGLAPESVVWDDPGVAWRAYVFVLVRSPWDYPAKTDAFLAWHAAVGRQTLVANSSAASQKSVSKGYLRELAERGVPVVPTVVVTEATSVFEVSAKHGWNDVVVKPAIGLGGRSVSLVRDVPHATVPSRSIPGEYCVQPYMAAIETEGEYSIVCLDGAPSHATRKRLALGEFRIHEKFGGTHERYPLTDELRAFGERLLDATDMHHELVARFDAIRDGAGQLRLLEMDLFRPCLYLCHRPEAADLLAQAIAARLRRPQAERSTA